MSGLKKGNYATFSLCATLSVLYFTDIPVTAWTFHFVHGNVFHLCCNIISISILLPSNLRLLPAAYLAASLSWFVSQNAIGFSGIIFFLWGARAISDFMNIFSKILKFRYLSAILISLSLSLFIPALSFSVHVLPFLSGLAVNAVSLLIGNYKNALRTLYKK